MNNSGGGPVFSRDFAAPYGKAVQVSALIARLLARNPGPFTFRGTGVAIVGQHQLAVIDPGPDDPEHLAALRAAVDGRRVTHILVTHTHRDHSPAARALQQWTGAPTYGFGPHGAEGSLVVEEGGDRAFVPTITVRDGDLIESDEFSFECVHTPGHTSNHICYALRQERALFSGDHVMGWSSTVVAPPDGDMAAYMQSLEKLLPRDDTIYWPTHGGAVTDPKPFVSALLRHRQAREAQILDTVRAGAHIIPEITRRVYTGIDPRLMRAAALNVLAHLLKLTREGGVVADAAGLTGKFEVPD